MELIEDTDLTTAMRACLVVSLAFSRARGRVSIDDKNERKTIVKT